MVYNNPLKKKITANSVENFIIIIFKLKVVFTITKSSFNIGLLTSIFYKTDVKLNAVAYL